MKWRQKFTKFMPIVYRKTMDLHRRGPQADWEAVPPGQRTYWQRLAAKTLGVLTLGNLISLVGAVLVILSAYLITQRNYLPALLALLTGRLADLLDGLAADLTKTKSPLGETIDAVSDKVGLLIILPAVAVEQLVPIGVVALMLVYGITNACFGILSKVRKIVLHPTFEGKLATAACWFGIGAFLLSATIVTLQPWHALLLAVAWVCTVIFIVLGYQSSSEYAGLLFKSHGEAPPFKHIILIINPQSSNIHRVKKRADELARLFPEQAMTILETTVQPSQFAAKLHKTLAALAEPVLLAIGGGDGTVNLVLNSLMDLSPDSDTAAIALLPLWGGNANDFAYMLNGPSSRASLGSVVARGQPVAIHPFKIKISRPGRPGTTHYAASYASFGASAYTADRLAQPGKDKRLFGKSTASKITSEVVRVFQAMVDAPLFDAEQDGQRMKIFEQVFANGSRMAKVDRLPVKLNEKAFYRAVQSEKHPLYLLVQFLRGKQIGQVSDKSVRFTIRERAWAQFDGEVMILPANTVVSVGLAKTPFYALSTKLDPATASTTILPRWHHRLRVFGWGVLLLLAGHVWLAITDPYAKPSIVQSPYSASVDNGHITLKKNFTLNVYSNFAAQWLGYYKSGFLIAEHTFSPAHLTDRQTPQQTIADIHAKRFDPSRPYLISGEPFSVLYPRNLGVFYNSLLDPRTALDQADWQHRQQIYLQSALYALDAFSASHKLTTTIVPISQHTVALTEVHPGSVPSDSLYGLLYALRALSQPSPYQAQTAYTLQTVDTTRDILSSRRADVADLLRLYVAEVQDPSTGLIKRHLTLSGARDGVIRDNSFYDNVVLWKTLGLASELGVQHCSPAYLASLRADIINQYWDNRSGIFSDQYRSAGQPATFSADWLIALPTGFLDPNNDADRQKLARIVDYTEQSGLAAPLPIQYAAANTPLKVPTFVHIFDSSYGGNLIWSYWGTQYITLLDNLSQATHDSHYAQLAGRDLQAYTRVLARYGGFPETLNPDGTFHKTLFYKSILDTGWVVQYEQARYEYMHPAG